ncbi:phosphatase PAP2 family protein [Clostridium carnis]
MVIDLFFINLMKNIKSDFLDSLFTNIIFEKSIYIWIILILVLLCIKNTRKFGVILGISFLITLIIGEGVLKNLIGRERPFITYGYEIIGNKPNSFSFPSASAALSFTMFGVFLFNKNRYNLVIGVFALIVAISRIYLGVHYFSDVLGGIILGFLSSYFVNKLIRKYMMIPKEIR